jgi:hypothetical protein
MHQEKTEGKAEERHRISFLLIFKFCQDIHRWIYRLSVSHIAMCKGIGYVVDKAVVTSINQPLFSVSTALAMRSVFSHARSIMLVAPSQIRNTHLRAVIFA